LPERSASAATVVSLSPRFRIVSIIPGIEAGAPDRTLTSSGWRASPNALRVSSSTRRSAWATSASSPSG
jgi:hypothetical protein